MDESKQLVELLSGTAMLLKSIADPCLADQLATKQLQIVKQKLESPSLAMDAETAMTLNSKIDAVSGWTQEARQTLQILVSNKAAATMSLPARQQTHGRRTTQDFGNLVHYLPSSIWAKLHDSSQNFNTRMEVLGKFAAMLGLTCPNEHTYAAALTILHLAAPGANPDAMSSSQKHEQLKRFKPVFKNALESHGNRSTMGLAKLPIDFNSAAEHPLIKAAFKDELPMQCPWQQKQFNAFVASIPLRLTNASVSGFLPFARAAAWDQFGNQLSFSSMHRNASQMPDEIPMQYFLRPVASSAASTSIQGTPPLALTYPVANRAATLSLPAISDQPSKPAAPTEPLTLPALAHNAGVAADEQHKKPETELPATQTTKSEDPLALIASLQTKRAEAKALAAAAAKAAKATSEEVEPKKRPASKPASNCKSSSSSCKSALKANTKAMKKAAAATASLSTAKRLRVSPKG